MIHLLWEAREVSFLHDSLSGRLERCLPCMILSLEGVPGLYVPYHTSGWCTGLYVPLHTSGWRICRVYLPTYPRVVYMPGIPPTYPRWCICWVIPLLHTLGGVYAGIPLLHTLGGVYAGIPLIPP